jgi:hypothetical protein
MTPKRRGHRSCVALLRTAALGVILAAAAAGCGKGESKPAPPPPADAAPTPDAAVAVFTPDAGVAAPVLPALEERPVTLASAVKEEKIKRLTVKAKIPAGWTPSGKQAFAAARPAAQTAATGEDADPFPALLRYGIACDGKCKAAEVEKAVARRVVGFTSELATPELESARTQKPAKKGKRAKQPPTPPSVRLDVTVLDQGDEDGRRFLVAKVVVPPSAPAKAKRQYHDALEAICTVHRRRDGYYVFTRARAPLRYETTLWPILLEACKATAY